MLEKAVTVTSTLYSKALPGAHDHPRLPFPFLLIFLAEPFSIQQNVSRGTRIDVSAVLLSSSVAAASNRLKMIPLTEMIPPELCHHHTGPDLPVVRTIANTTVVHWTEWSKHVRSGERSGTSYYRFICGCRTWCTIPRIFTINNAISLRT